MGQYTVFIRKGSVDKLGIDINSIGTPRDLAKSGLEEWDYHFTGSREDIENDPVYKVLDGDPEYVSIKVRDG